MLRSCPGKIWVRGQASGGAVPTVLRQDSESGGPIELEDLFDQPDDPVVAKIVRCTPICDRPDGGVPLNGKLGAGGKLVR